jgi:hypothetical protein
VPPLKFENDRFLIWEVLVQRRDVYAGAFCDVVGREPVPAVLDQNVSCRFQDRVNGAHGALLDGSFCGASFSFHAPSAALPNV